MSFLAPLWLAVAGLVAAGVVVAHLFSTSVPPRDVLPTVRFIPDRAPVTVRRSRKITDALLLLLRLLVVALLGLALSGAHLPRSAPARVVVADLSRAVGSVAELRDSVAAVAGSGATLIAFDSSARVVTPEALRASVLSGARGSLSAGIVAAHRSISEAVGDRERAELILVSPVVREEVDSATARVLALWEGPVRVVHLRSANASAQPRWEIRSTADDPVTAALAATPGRGTGGAVRVVRDVATAADSQWARGGGALIVWPASNEAGVLRARAAADSQGGIATEGHVAVAPFARRFQPRAGRALVRWADGEPAATEQPLGTGCVREVAIPVDPVGDLPLRDSFRGIARSLLEPCGGARDFRPASLEGRSSARDGQSAATRLSAPPATDAGALPLWLAVVALALLVLEQVMRARAKAVA